MRKTILNFRKLIAKIAEENNNADSGVALDIAMQIADDFIKGNVTKYRVNDVTPDELAEFIKYVQKTDSSLIAQDRKAYNEYYLSKWKNDDLGSIDVNDEV